MAPSKSVHRDNPGSNRSDTIIIPSGSESHFDDRETVTGPNTSRTGAKRKALVTFTSLPPGKRTQRRDIPEKRRLPPPHDPRFWYPDGNVVIRVGYAHFKLLRSRLAHQCRYFQALFSPPAQNQSQPSSSTGISRPGSGGRAPFKEIDGCAVYEVPGIDVSDFTTFITFLEYPLDHSVSTAPCGKLYALLRASDILGCDLVYGLAKKAVENQWPSLKPPARDAKARRSAVDGQVASEAIGAIEHARKYRIPNVVKCAFYELLRNKDFWDAVDNTHANSHGTLDEQESEASAASARNLLAPLSREDLVGLQQARWKLREAWDKLVRTPPGSDAGWKMTTCGVCPPALNGQPRDRKDVWVVETAHAGYCVEFGDPIAGTYRVEDWLDGLKQHSQGRWCEGCLEERQWMWKEARKTWWQQLDGWLQTGVGVSAARVPDSDRRDSDAGPRKRLLV